MKFRFGWPAFVTLVITTGIVAANIVWISKTNVPPMWDMAGHETRSIIYGRLVAAGHFGQVLTQDALYPPLTYLVTGVTGWFAHFPEKWPQYSLAFYVIITAWALYVLARRWNKNPWVAPLAVLLALCFPLLAHFSRVYDLDLPLTAMVTLSLLALVQTNHFRNRRWSIVAGVIAGLGLMTKWTWAVFVVGPLLVTLWPTWQSKQRAAWINLAWAVGIAAVLAGPWYVIHARHIAATAIATQGNGFSVPVAHLFSWANLWYYPKTFVRGIGWVFALVTLVGIFLAWRKKQWMPIAWLLGGYLIMTFGSMAKESRYLLPAYPAAAFFIAQVVAWPRQRVWNIVASTFAVILALAMWTQASWRASPVLAAKLDALRLSKTFGLNFDLGYGYTYPVQYGQNISIAIQSLATTIAHAPAHHGTWHVAVVPNSMVLSDSTANYFIAKDNLPIDTSLSPKLRSKNYAAALAQADFLLTKTGNQGPTAWTPFLNDLVAAEATPWTGAFSRFRLVQTWPLLEPDGTTTQLRLYQRSE